jgi:putative DNA primase/helicase
MKPYDEAARYLIDNLEKVCAFLFPAGKRQGTNFLIGDINGQAGCSFSIALEPPARRGQYKDFSTNQPASRNLPKLWKIARGIPEDNHARFFADLSAFAGQTFSWNGSNNAAGPTWPNWPDCLAKFSDADAGRLAGDPKRQYKLETVQWLHAQEHLGLYRGDITFAMRSLTGEVTGVHRWINGKLKFLKSPTLWVLGDPGVARFLHIHESVWDLIAMIDRTGWHLNPEVLCFCTRGTSGAKLVTGRIPATVEKIYLWEQREPPNPKTGISPNAQWQAKIAVAAGAVSKPVYVVRVPENCGGRACKDLNDWTIAGATADQIAFACELAALYAGQAAQAKPPGPTFASTPQDFPPADARPCYRVYFSPLKINEREYRPGLYLHEVVTAGDKDYPRDTWICTPLLVVAKTATSKNRNYGRLLEYQSSNGIKRNWAMPMELLAGDGAQVLARLLDDGVEISHANRRKVLEYLSAEQPADFLRCATRTGWYSDITFVLTEEIITPKNSTVQDKVWFQAAAKTAEYLRAGKFENWRDQVAGKAPGNNYLVFAIAFSLSGPLLRLLGLRGIGVHLYGDSTSGKTSVSEVAASSWGHGHDFLQTWNLTANGIETVCVEHTDTFLGLDEIKEIDARDLDRVAYSVVNGQGKIRSDRTGAARSPHLWRVALFSTGEYSIRARLAEAGIDIKTGQELRLVDLPVTSEKFGIFSNLHGGASAAQFANELRSSASVDYGHAGPLQVEAILGYSAERLRQGHDKIIALFNASGAQERRVAEMFAAVALAGEIAARHKIVPWSVATTPDFSDSDSANAAVALFNRWKENRTSSANFSSEHSRIMEAVTDAFERHGDSRFEDFNPIGHPFTPPNVRDRLGWYDDSSGNRIYLVLTSGLREITRGFDFNRVLRALDQAGALVNKGANKTSRTARIPGGAGYARVFYIDPEKLQP